MMLNQGLIGMRGEFYEEPPVGVRSPLLSGEPSALRWIPLAIAGASMLGGMMGSKKTQGTKIERVPSTLSKKDLKPTAGKYQGLVNDYLDSEPGRSGHEIQSMKKDFRRSTAAGARGQEMKSKQYAATHNIRGAAGQKFGARVAENQRAANYQFEVQTALQEHMIRESDVARRAAVAAGFLWPAEQARGAGQIASTSTVGGDSKDEKITSGLGAASRAYGQFMNDQPTGRGGRTTPANSSYDPTGARMREASSWNYSGTM